MFVLGWWRCGCNNQHVAAGCGTWKVHASEWGQRSSGDSDGRLFECVYVCVCPACDHLLLLSQHTAPPDNLTASVVLLALQMYTRSQRRDAAVPVVLLLQSSTHASWTACTATPSVCVHRKAEARPARGRECCHSLHSLYPGRHPHLYVHFFCFFPSFFCYIYSYTIMLCVFPFFCV